jgi:hypothetical protein
MDSILNSKEPVCITGSVALAGAAKAAWALRARSVPPENDDE